VSRAAGFGVFAAIATLGAGCGLAWDIWPPAPDGAIGSACGNDPECSGCAVCVSGACAAADGLPCQRRDSCEVGRYACTGSTPVCRVETIALRDQVCREARGSCDLTERCDGMSGACPADIFFPVETPCPEGTCDGAGNCGRCVDGEDCDTGTPCEQGLQQCAGGRRRCVASGARPAGAVCRPKRDRCDADEVCDGASLRCPADAIAPAGVTCRPPDGECDAEEKCSGLSETCPADEAIPIGTPCSDGACDGAGNCTSDCRPGLPCDMPDPCELAQTSCDGGTLHCVGLGTPAPAGTPCRPSAGPCDVEETCDGGSLTCPADQLLTRDAACRDRTAPCDVAELCDGMGPGCPPDEVAAAGVTCRASAGTCDVAEVCTGAGSACPSDAVAIDALCRASAGDCDVAETCTGSVDCPADVLAPAGMLCATMSTMGTCDGAGMCVTGCVPGVPCLPYLRSCAWGMTDCFTGMPVCVSISGFAPAGTICGPGATVCDPEEVCSGVDLTCPADINMCRSPTPHCCTTTGCQPGPSYC